MTNHSTPSIKNISTSFVFSSLYDEDFCDIFLILMELVTFKNRDLFYSQKHQMIKWDLVKQKL